MSKCRFIIFLGLLGFSALVNAQGLPITIDLNGKMVIKTENAPEPIGPYNQAILIKGTLYVSGQIGIDVESGDLVSGNIEDETMEVMENLGAILKAAGMDFTHVVKCSIFLSDMGNFAKVNEVYGQYFPNNAPARETVEVAKLPKDANVEISCIAVK